jgi:hypothetical protein
MKKTENAGKQDRGRERRLQWVEDPAWSMEQLQRAGNKAKRRKIKNHAEN